MYAVIVCNLSLHRAILNRVVTPHLLNLVSLQQVVTLLLPVTLPLVVQAIPLQLVATLPLLAVTLPPLLVVIHPLVVALDSKVCL